MRSALDWLPQGKRLVTVMTDCDLTGHVMDWPEFESLALREVDRDGLLDFYNRFGFKALKRELENQMAGGAEGAPRERFAEPVIGVSVPVDKRYETVLSMPQLEGWLRKIEAAPLVAIDTETDSLDPMTARILGISLSVAVGEAAYIPLRHSYAGAPDQLAFDDVMARLKPWLENPDAGKLGQNIKYDGHVFANAGIQVRGYLHDTLLQSYVLEAHRPHSLDSLVQRHLEPARAPIRVAPDASSFVAASGRATRPPDHTITRAVVATRAPRREGPRPADAARVEGASSEGPRSDGPRAGNGVGAPPPRIVPAPKSASTVARPTFGNSQVERQRPPQPRQFGAPEPPEATRGARDNNGQRPDGNTQRPDGNPQRRDGNNTQRPDGNVQRHESNAPRPDNAQRPDTNAQRPGNAQRPDGNARRPDNSSARPDGSTQRPDSNVQRPDGNVQRPGPGPAGPREGARGQRQPPPQAQQQAPRPERVEGRGPQQQRLPGEPANRISPERAESRRQQPEAQPQERRGGGGKEQPGR